MVPLWVNLDGTEISNGTEQKTMNPDPCWDICYIQDFRKLIYLCLAFLFLKIFPFTLFNWIRRWLYTKGSNIRQKAKVIFSKSLSFSLQYNHISVSILSIITVKK